MDSNQKRETRNHKLSAARMRVAMYYNNSDVRLEELPVPRVGPGELLIRTRASGICGSDLMEWYRVKKAPLVLGHEITGEIVELGAAVANFKVGDRVFSSHHVPCGKCRYCLSGHQSVCDLLRDDSFRSRRLRRVYPRATNQCGAWHLADCRTR